MDQPEHDPEALHEFVGELLTSEASTLTMPSLTVHVDVCELLADFDKDEQRLFEFIGKLKDLLA